MAAAYVSESCPTCSTVFERARVDGDEDGNRYADLDARKCSQEGCGNLLCSSCPQFECDGCGKVFCSDHAIPVFELKCCVACAVEAVESNEPDCACRQTGVDLFDGRGCELHDSRSSWNTARRAITMIQRYERAVA